MSRIVGCLYLLIWLAESTASAGSLLGVRVHEFQFHGKSQIVGHVKGDAPGELFSAALALGQHAEVRICIEALPRESRSTRVPIEINVKHKTVGEILELMVQQDPRYEFRERMGVIEVLPTEADKDSTNCLNMVIPVLRVSYPWKYAWAAIRCQMETVFRHPDAIVPDPMRQASCAGASHLAHPPETPLDATFEREPVRDILDKLTSMAGNVAWFASFKDSSRGCESLQLGEYQPRGWFPVEPNRGDNPKMMQGLPSSCTNCHYHKGQSPAGAQR